MKRKLLALFLLTLLSFSLSACKQKEVKETEIQEDTPTAETTETAEPQPGEIPFDYPVVETTAQAGDYVLAPSIEFIEDAFKEGGENSNFIFYAGTMIEPGEKESIVEDMIGDQNSIPNSLIIPIKPNQSAEVGDVILTWWQSGSGLTKAIVTEGGTEPKVKYLDAFIETEDKLLANSFHKLSGDMEPGITVAIKRGDRHDHGIVINISGNKVLVMGFAGFLSVEDKGDLTVIPPTIDVAVGDKVMAPIIDSFDTVTVKEVNAGIGQIVGEYEFAGEISEDIFLFGDIIKAL